MSDNGSIKSAALPIKDAQLEAINGGIHLRPYGMPAFTGAWCWADRDTGRPLLVKRKIRLGAKAPIFGIRRSGLSDYPARYADTHEGALV